MTKYTVNGATTELGEAEVEDEELEWPFWPKLTSWFVNQT